MDELPQAIAGRLRDKLEETCAFSYLFGSLFTDRFNEESDVDLAIFELEGEEHGYLYWLKTLSSCTDHALDLIVLNRADPIITMQIIGSGSLLTCHDRNFLNQFKAREISKYLDFKRNRQGIEQRLMLGAIYD